MNNLQINDPLNADEYAAKCWQKNTDFERKKLHELLKNIMTVLPHRVGIGMIYIIMETDPPSFHNKTMKRIIYNGHQVIEKVDGAGHYSPSYESYKNKTGVELAQQFGDGTDDDLMVIGFGVIDLFVTDKFHMPDYLALVDALDYQRTCKRRNYQGYILWPEIPEVALDIQAEKEKTITDKLAIIDGKNVEGIVRYTVELSAAKDIEDFEKKFGSDHLFEFADGSWIGIAVERGTGQPWKNFINIRSEDLKRLGRDNDNKE